MTDPQVTEGQCHVENSTDDFTDERDLWMQKTTIADCCDVLAVGSNDSVKVVSG